MARLLAIDYGTKRTGLAVTDPQQIIASALTTVPTHQLFDYLHQYLQQEEVEAVVIGQPQNLQGGATDNSAPVQQFANRLRKLFPALPVHWHDERFTSKMALDAMIRAGSTKK
ncbi:MAG TPA: Holliday junction resolvase RuvX, partial [Flammeovirgaceae bacterium]|nr:Holliday junction resolvase RuvX [Flammeovirgaceae bacterium]